MCNPYYPFAVYTDVTGANNASFAAALSSGPSTTPQRDASKNEELSLPGDLSAPDFIRAPVSPAQRSAYRAWIGGKWRWSEALPELQYFYETHGFGVTSTDSGLKWVDGLLEACDYDRTHMSLGIKGASGSTGSTESKGLPHEVLQHIENFAKGSEDQKGLVYMGQQTVNLGLLVKAVGPHGIRVLHLNSTDLTKLANVASALYLYPRVKFAVVCKVWCIFCPVPNLQFPLHVLPANYWKLARTACKAGFTFLLVTCLFQPSSSMSCTTYLWRRIAQSISCCLYSRMLQAISGLQALCH